MNLLKFITAGSVDDGKSTLIGRLLFDAQAVLDDQLAAIEKSRIRNENGSVNLALLTDGLKAEREQGITIDVAYKYFATSRRKFIIIDAPGHVQYTRNMVTGASNADLIIVLIDARKGVIEQTRRHSYIASLLRIPQVVVCVNKMDLVGYDEKVYNKIVSDYEELAKKVSLKKVVFFPVSALNGDNVVEGSDKMPWHKGGNLLDYLETIHVEAPEDAASNGHAHRSPGRFPVQYVVRPQSKDYHDYRGLTGQIASGTFRKGETVRVLPADIETKIAAIDIFENGELREVEQASHPMSVTMRLENEIDVSRGDLIAQADDKPLLSQDFEANLCWMDAKPLVEGSRFWIRHTTHLTRATVKKIKYKVDIHTFEKIDNHDGSVKLAMNDIAHVYLRTAQPIAFDPYEKNRATGSLILIDEATNVTVGALMADRALDPENLGFTI